jgi:MSHA pilin protein MshC
MTRVCTARPCQEPPAGFTMIELVIVMVLVGILAAYALPRLNTASLQVMPVAEQIAAEIRYTQNLAMSRSEAHTFEVSGNTITINGGAVALSNGQGSVTFSGVSVSPASVTFSPRFGQPSGGASINVDGGGSSVSVQVAGETGYVTVN